jgi:uncharacterized membrane protein YqjE
VARESTGIVGDVKALASTGLRAVRTRLELLAIEVTEEKAWMVRFLMVALAALYLASFGLLLAIFAVVAWASAESRPAILAAFAGVFLLLGGGGLGYIVTASRRRLPIFADTIAVLKGDEQALHAGASGD